MAHALTPDFAFPRNGRVHLNRWGRQFSRLLAAEVCASAWVMLDTPWSQVAWEYWLPTPFVNFHFISPPVRHRVPPGSERALHTCISGTAQATVGRDYRCILLTRRDTWWTVCLVSYSRPSWLSLMELDLDFILWALPNVDVHGNGGSW
jgi:hypothetical protein